MINISSSYSFNGSLIQTKSLNGIEKLGYKALGLVDTSTAFYINFYSYLKSHDIKPILGFRVRGKNYDYIIYAKNSIGYKKILYYASEITPKDDAKDVYDLIKDPNLIYVFDLSHFTSENFSNIKEEYDFLVNEGYSVYLGVDFLYYPCEVGLYPQIKDNYKCLTIESVKYINEDDKEASDVLHAILNQTKIEEPNIFDIEGSISHHLKNYNSFINSYKDYPELIKELNDFVSQIDIEIETTKVLPKYQNSYNMESSEFLRALANKGLKRRLSGTSKDLDYYKKRLDYELDIIHRMGFDDYFLVVYDFVLYAKKNNIYVGPGRGSSSSSLVSYSLGIVEVDPIEYSLYFERFLNPERKTMPDIDIDIEDTRRDDVIRYVSERYGLTHVSLISTYQTFLAKSSIRDVSKVLEIDDTKVNMLASLINETENSIDALMLNTKAKTYYQNDDDYKRIIDISKKIEGLPRSIGTHAAGVIISDKDLREYSEIHMGQSGFIQTTYDSDSLKYIGLLKMDFLSLKNLSIIHDIVSDIEKYEHKKINIFRLRLDDPDTYRYLSSKSTLGIFQLESPGISDLLRKMKVRNINDLALVLALYRPGPMESIPTYLRRRNGKERIDYYDKSIENVLKETLGVVVFQEQTMAIVSRYAGLSLADADIIRRAMSSKDESLINSIKERFFESSLKMGRNEDVTKKLFSDIESFAGYGFNKAHAISYSLISYYLAFLKTHYTKYFLANLLKSSSSIKYIKECNQLGIKVMPPDARFSRSEYTVHDTSIYMPYTEIKGIGYSYSNEIVHLLKEANYDFESFIRLSKDKLPRGLVEDLIYSGVFDYTKYNKNTLISSLDGLFEFDSSLVKGMKNKIEIKDEYSFDYLKEKEFDLLSINFKYHPIKLYKGDYDKISDIEVDPYTQKTIVAYIRGLKRFKTKNNTYMAKFYIEDEFKSVSAIIFSKEYLSYEHILKDNNLYILEGTYRKDNNSDDEIFIVRRVFQLNE